ncbi:hypothetical protein SM124_09155 [Bacillus sp. 31A1R]|uniref:Uncharacterized protein n=1 Tax=Robertmurraya mangrovi TaxID=3098077 RepID=A0ABU5IXL4_9BACI|nr:hypothetical protein [Bacillus sp. 31A1R]MDZ5471914.1 hypothetical protein [Bacillus sp. 31A1R]
MKSILKFISFMIQIVALVAIIAVFTNFTYLTYLEHNTHSQIEFKVKKQEHYNQLAKLANQYLGTEIQVSLYNKDLGKRIKALVKKEMKFMKFPDIDILNVKEIEENEYFVHVIFKKRVPDYEDIFEATVNLDKGSVDILFYAEQSNQRPSLQMLKESLDEQEKDKE